MANRIYFLCLLLCVFSFGKGQTNVYHPFPDSNAVWCETINYPVVTGIGECHVEEDYQLFIKGDTVIGPFQYHKLYASGFTFSLDCPYPPGYNFYNSYKGAIRQDSSQKKGFVIPAGLSDDSLFYDYNLSVGNTFRGMVISSIDSVLAGGNYRKRFWINSGGDYFIEGIGSTFGLLQGQSGGSFISRFHAFSQNAQTIYVLDSTFDCNAVLGIREKKQNLSLEIFPNPSAGMFTIDFGNSLSAKKIMITDILGNAVLTQSIFNQPKFEIRNFPVGIFILIVRDDENKISIRKIISEP